jgi:DNA polymerase III subunit gamma/tau
VRDALSILDQAIASSGGRLTAEAVRQLVGTAPAGVLEEVMQAVARSASDEVLKLVDRLISEGHSPTHFARQMVRFLRNTVVAKIAGGESSLLQISSDERQRVTRVAELFGEEDLARHLQIMLRTHSELGYRQEQRFHLELGLLKMAHAQRLLPIEQLLSEAAAQGGSRPAGRPSVVPDVRKPEIAAVSRPSNQVSPFAADSARKSGSKPQLSAEESPTASRVVMGAAAPAVVAQAAPEDSPLPGIAVATASLPDELRNAVLGALAGQPMLVTLLENGEWSLEGNELLIKVASSSTVIEMSLSADARRLVIATASGVLGRPLKLRVVPSGKPPAAATGPVRSNVGGRGRVDQDPIVQRMKEKFGAEVRTVIDYKDKR